MLLLSALLGILLAAGFAYLIYRVVIILDSDYNTHLPIGPRSQQRDKVSNRSDRQQSLLQTGVKPTEIASYQRSKPETIELSNSTRQNESLSDPVTVSPRVLSDPTQVRKRK